MQHCEKSLHISPDIKLAVIKRIHRVYVMKIFTVLLVGAAVFGQVQNQVIFFSSIVYIKNKISHIICDIFQQFLRPKMREMNSKVPFQVWQRIAQIKKDAAICRVT